MRMWFRPVKGIAFCIVAAFFGSQAMAQVQVKRSFPSAKRISAFDNTTFCTAFLSDGSLLTIRDIPIVDLRDVDKIAFNPTGSSLALMRGKKPVSIYSFRDRNKKLFELKEQRKSKELKSRKNLNFFVPGPVGAELMKDASKGDIVPVAMCYGADARNFFGFQFFRRNHSLRHKSIFASGLYSGKSCRDGYYYESQQLFYRCRNR